MKEKKQNRIGAAGRIVMLFLVFICSVVLLSGCGKTGSSQHDGASQKNGAKVSTEKKAGKSKEKKSQNSADRKEKRATKKGEKSDQGNSEGTGKEAGKRTTTKDAERNNRSRSAKSSSSSSAKRNAVQKKKAKKSGHTAGSRKQKCTISISAMRLHASKKADESIKKLVPSDGYLLHKTTEYMKQGDTVKDILKRAARAHHIALSFKGANYVAGIGGIFEFDGGKNSGWMYSVNDVFPNVACNEKKVKPGDRIDWKYTLNLGNDL